MDKETQGQIQKEMDQNVIAVSKDSEGKNEWYHTIILSEHLMLNQSYSGRKTNLHESKWNFSGRVTRKDRGLPETYEEL